MTMTKILEDTYLHNATQILMEEPTDLATCNNVKENIMTS